MKYGSFEITVLVKGKAIREYNHVDGNTYIEGRRNSTFELKFRNLTTKRVLAVPAVDGLSVMDGKIVNPSSSGFVVGPYGTQIVKGWHIDTETGAEFIFRDRKHSYTELSGEGDANVGVIGLLVYEEAEQPEVKKIIHEYRPYPYYPAPWRQPVWVRDQIWMDNGWSSTGNAPVNPQEHRKDAIARNMSSSVGATLYSCSTGDRRINLDQKQDHGFEVGTGFGESFDQNVNMVDFKRKSETPVGQLVIFYDSRKNLEKRGIEVRPDHWSPDRVSPNPFPGMPSVGCKPPPNWKG